MFKIQDDMVLPNYMVLPIGKEYGELNMIILIPKTEKRASEDDVSLNKLLKSRINDPEALKVLTDTYTGRNSLNLKKVKLKVEVYLLESGQLLGNGISGAIFDEASKAHGAMDLHDATPLRSCADGGRKIVMIAEFGLAKDVEPRFQLYDSEGKRLKDQEENLLNQPSNHPVKTVSIMKETIVFITPNQPHAETIMKNRWTVKLVARRTSDGLVSKTKFNFDYVPHDFYSPCVFCAINPDKQDLGHATIAPMRDVARPGLRKRQMSGTEVRDFSDKPDLIEDDNEPFKKQFRQNNSQVNFETDLQTTIAVNDETIQPSDDESKINSKEKWRCPVNKVDQVLRMYNDSGSSNLLSHRDSETTPFLQKFYTETSEKHIGFLPFFYSLVHLMRWKVVTKDKDMLPVLSLTWHKILLSSQKYFPPKHSKAISTSDRYGTKCATF